MISGELAAGASDRECLPDRVLLLRKIKRRDSGPTLTTDLFIDKP